MGKIAILIAGDPIESARRVAGGFDDMIRTSVILDRSDTISSTDVRCHAPPPLATVDGIIITGSPHSVMERLPWMLRLEAYIRAAVEERCCVLGLCFGHQSMATALGGTVSRNPNGKELGMVTAVPLHADDVLGFPGAPFSVFMAHNDAVVRLPPGSRALACTPRDAHAAIKFGPRAWGVQFHPEFSHPVTRAYIEANRDALVAQGDDPDGLARALGPTPLSSEILRGFCRVALASELGRA